MCEEAGFYGSSWLLGYTLFNKIKSDEIHREDGLCDWKMKLGAGLGRQVRQCAAPGGVVELSIL